MRNTFIGSPVERREDLRFVRGRGEYVDDLEPDGLLHAVILRSGIAHGRIRSIEATAALKVKGVHAVITALAADEIIVEIRLPAWPATRRWAFKEFARRRGDFAMAGTALFYDVDADGKARNAHVGAIGVGDRPQRLAGAEDAINGNAVDIGTCERAGAAASAAVTPQSDIHASAAYRKALLGTLVERALQSACA